MRQLEQRIVEFQTTARFTDLRFDDTGNGEVLQQCHQIGEGLVEGQLIGVGRVVEVAIDAVEDAVCGFVRNDVMGEAGEGNTA